ncbi:prion-inhibition and propagation-domain-containing protein [Stachybotrys elegans]|uniref:Prion-inhibition and propagation-domain-containing protein n=1 Tax=Stachybotrys elegans TaxID=80388 RepID=A0A8K0SL00_9HYPO|nr:prion-inhibition and propagation-domain-containing protein [Stachybotrys elegans]
METAGLALGVLGVVGVFKSCIDLFSLFSSYRSVGRDHSILEAKLHVEKTLLLQWARRSKLLEPEHDTRLDDPAVLEAVTCVLESTRFLMSESSILQDRYGVQPSNTTADEPVLATRVALLSKARMDKFTTDFNALRIRTTEKRTDERNESRSAMRKFRWIIADKDKFGQLIEELSHFVSKLNQLMPEPSSENEVGLEDMSREDMRMVGDLKSLRLIRAATSDRLDTIGKVVEERLNEVSQHSILSLIWFRSMDDRKEGIVPPHPQTFEWALEPPQDAVWDNLEKWLAAGSRIYWISGKAGSGKSTLMKYLYTNPKALKLLRNWAILYQVLEAEPHLTSELLPRLWQETLRELSTAFRILSSKPDLKRFFCFFIDGLDEFSGNHLEGITVIKGLVQNSKIKVVLSSRPIPSCDLARKDIECYIKDSVTSHPYMLELFSSDRESAEKIVEELTEKAAGVFLWVVLACRSLLDGFAAYDSTAELLHRLNELPPELDDLFQHMLNQVEPRYREQAAKTLKICYQRQITWGYRDETASVYTLPLAIFDSCGFSCSSTPLRQLSLSGQRAICVPMEGRLRSRCGGLLELRKRSQSLTDMNCFCGTNDHDPLTHSTIGFMHRTVFEFLDRPLIWSMPSLRISDQSFNSNAALALMNFQIFLLLAVESGMTNCIRYYLPRVNEESLPFPLLYYAIRQPMLWRRVLLPPSDITIQCLLSLGSLPNKPFKNQEGITTTPWRDWLRELHRMDRSQFFETIPITEEFIKGETVIRIPGSLARKIEKEKEEEGIMITTRHSNG